jgi:hypothetical protein
MTGNTRDDVQQGFLTKQKGHKHTQRMRERTETVEELRFKKANIKRRLEELEAEELEHDDYLGEDYSHYIK